MQDAQNKLELTKLRRLEPRNLESLLCSKGKLWNLKVEKTKCIADITLS